MLEKVGKMNMHIVDESGEIICTIYAENVDRFYHEFGYRIILNSLKLQVFFK